MLEPAGRRAASPSDLVVDFDLFLNPDGSVAQPPQLTGQSLGVAAIPIRARPPKRRGARSMNAQPYKLPADRYSQWREINPLHFDPRQMMGQ